jgi:GTP-binding protein
MGALADAIAAYMPAEDEPAAAPAAEGAVAEDDADDGPRGPLTMTIVGRPNVGKSTLLNRLLGDERVLTGPEPGVTRDAIAVDWQWRDRAVRLIDTAGLRRRARIEEKIEQLSVGETLRAVRFSHVVVLVMDATMPLERQDLTIARHAIEEGRALVLVLNKWDAVADEAEAMKAVTDRLEISLPQVRGVTVLRVSALSGRGLDRVMPAVAAAYDVWNKRVPTGRLNRWLEDALAGHPPPMVRGRRLKPRYITQVKARPPTFALFATRATEIPETYGRYLINDLRTVFDLPGVPIRLLLRGGKNPYDPSP